MFRKHPRISPGAALKRKLKKLLASVQEDQLPEIAITSEFREGIDLIDSGVPRLFITGGAGTGKSTFLDYIRRTKHQQGVNVAVLAPPGVAALNVRGQTIHSFFGFEAKPVNLDEIVESAKKEKLFRSLGLLIIDEISMVRADLLDGIERFLSLNGPLRGKPFGGVQIVVVGDLFQLPPVVATAEEARLFRERYATPYFFSADAFQSAPFEAARLTQVFRQQDAHFISLLEKLRLGVDTLSVVSELNERCCRPRGDFPLMLTLTPTNRAAGKINDQEIETLPGRAKCYIGSIEGAFSRKEDRLPAPLKLVLKSGAQVMFTKNDPDRRWVNGTTGVVRKLSGNAIKVCTREGLCVDVEPVEWETLAYEYDAARKQVFTLVTGSYTQFPLMPAWAVTIHKSQGLTLDAVHLDVGRGAFAPGQTYVALSRCRSMNGLSLERPLSIQDCMVDPWVQKFYQKMQETRAPGGFTADASSAYSQRLQSA